jgi:hypothetical protein
MMVASCGRNMQIQLYIFLLNLLHLTNIIIHVLRNVTAQDVSYGDN